MPLWIIEPRDPLIVRDGKPFGPNPGARATSLSFPFPSTVAGGIRRWAGAGTDGVFIRSKDNIERVKQIAIKGPLLVEIATESEQKPLRWMFPAPADALLLETDPPEHEMALLKPLVPLDTQEIGLTNLPNQPDGLHLVGQIKADPRKPFKDAPHFWYWEQCEQWLIAPQEDPISVKDWGHHGPQSEQRMHVSIQSETQTAIEGALFQTRGLEFTHKTEEKTRLALAVVTDDELKPFNGGKGGFAPLGGERRLMHWWQSSGQFPTCPEAIRASIVKHKACRVVLLTPACFAQGWYPTSLLQQHNGVQPTLKAIAVQRAQVISGWDLAANNGKGEPKPTRRLAPAGTVLFLTLDGSDDAITQWIDGHWMACVSDDAQDRRDGFGLAVLGTWTGELQLMGGTNA